MINWGLCNDQCPWDGCQLSPCDGRGATSLLPALLSAAGNNLCGFIVHLTPANHCGNEWFVMLVWLAATLHWHGLGVFWGGLLAIAINEEVASALASSLSPQSVQFSPQFELTTAGMMTTASAST